MCVTAHARICAGPQGKPWGYRDVRNWAVEQCRNAHKAAEKHPSYFTLTKLWTAARNADERNLEFGVTEQRSVIRGVTEGYKRFFN